MKEPKRLFDSGSSLERTILGYGREEAPSGDLARKTLAAMAAAPAASAASVAPSAWRRPRWIAGGVCALGLAAVVAGFVHRDEDHVQATPPPPAAPIAAPTETAPAAPPPAQTEIAVVTPDSLPSAPVRSAAPQGSMPAPRPVEVVPASSASIAREVELLDVVKAKLGAGDTTAATRALDVYDGEFPQGTLRPEATVLRVRTLLARGERASAEKIGAEFLAKHPTGVHAKRVRMLLGETPAAAGSGPRQK